MSNKEKQSEDPGFACNRMPESSRCLKRIKKGNCPADGKMCCSQQRGLHPVYVKNIIARKPAPTQLGSVWQCHEKDLNSHGSFVNVVNALPA